ncbi:MAG: winged helix-turn-helix transcriptional regulator [Gemmatimonadetes bacterium]|nr:winged helix-turn-helix transcriptional regulator [Gemmatimonadota bacterium]MYJ11869.1 winged helix-turn-helix transcriptional regulator [Gemmatimonadota bacterium]
MTPESQNIEWKRSWRDEHLKWISGFANAQGGVLEIGKDDRGEVVGVKEVLRLLEEIPNKVQSLLGIVVDVNLKSESGREYVEIAVEPHPNPISYKGEFHYRSGSTKQVLSGVALSRFLLERYGRTWDDVPWPGVGLKDLDDRAIDRFRRSAVESERLPPEVLYESVDSLIENLGLREGAYLKRGAVLLFHPSPHKLIPAYVKIGYFRGSEVFFQDMVDGDLFTQVDRTMDLLYSKYTRALISYDGIYRVETFPVPREAMREAVINAVIHRDYASQTTIQIRVYDDRISIWNAAHLPPEWASDQRAGELPSRPHNPQIANAFFRAGMIEAWGRGIRRIVDVCREADNPTPTWTLEAGGDGLWVRFPFSDAYQAADAVARGIGAGGTIGKTVRSFGSSDQRPETTQKTSRKHPEETDTSKSLADRIVAFLRANPSASRRELVEGLEGATEGSVKYQLGKLKRLGKLRRVGPDRGGRWVVVGASDDAGDGENDRCADDGRGTGQAPPEDGQKSARNDDQQPEHYQKTTRKQPDQTVQEPENPQKWSATARKQPEPLPLPDRILVLLAQNPSASRRKIAAALDTTASTVRYQLDKLRRTGKIERLGPDKGGHWKVLDGTATECDPMPAPYSGDAE